MPYIQLNEQQEQVANHMDGPCLVVAVPGSGKTATVTERFARLVQKGVDPINILCITFTNKAGDEMKNRILERMGVTKISSYIGTIHTFCASFLRMYGHLAGYSKGFTICDSDDQKSLIEKIIRLLGYDKATEKINVWDIISKVNTSRESCEIYEEMAERFKDKDAEWKIAQKYLAVLKKQNMIDFSGLLYETVQILEQSEEAREYAQTKYKYVMVDEVQDTNIVQFRLVNLIGMKTRNILMVGDFSQSIYRFRGARPENITDFLKLYPECVQIELPLNYRSTPEIVRHSETLIKHNKSHMAKQFITKNPSGECVKVREHANPFFEGRWIASEIRRIKIDEGWDGEDIAVLYRINSLSREIETALSSAGIPYVVIGGRSFYDRKEIRDCIAMIRFLANPTDGVSFARSAALFKGVGDTTIGMIEQIADDKGISYLDVCKDIAAHTNRKAVIEAAGKITKIFSFDTQGKGAGDCLSHLTTSIDYDNILLASCKEPDEYMDRKGNVQELINSATVYDKDKGNDVNAYLQNIALITSSDKKSRKETVSLMTVHAAKGLEFPVVFIIGVEKNLMPHSLAIHEAGGDREKEREAIEEERRICFVGMTRAKKRLYLSCCAKRQIRGKNGSIIDKPSFPSRFINEAGLWLDDGRG